MSDIFMDIVNKEIIWIYLAILFAALLIAFSLLVGILKYRRSEKELRRVNRVLKTLSQSNQILVRATNESDLLHEICRIIVEAGGYRLAWVGFVQQDEKKTVRPVAQFGFEEGYLDTVDLTWADAEKGRGGNPYGQAMYRKKYSQRP